MNFRARGFEREIWGGNRGFVSIGLKLFWFEWRTSYQQHPGGKFLAVDRRGINTKMKLLWFSLYDFLPATSGRKVSGRRFLEVISVGGTPTGLCARSWGGGAPPGTVCKRVTTVFKAGIWDRNRGFVYIGLKLYWFEKRTGLEVDQRWSHRSSYCKNDSTNAKIHFQNAVSRYIRMDDMS